MKTIQEMAQLATAVEQGDAPGIYYLFLEGELVYIGSSQWAKRRVQQHILEGVKKFDGFYIETLGTAETDLLTIEAEEILSHQPKLNYTVPVNQRYISSHALKRKHGIGKQQLNKFERKEGLYVIRFKDGAWYRRSDIARLFSCPDVLLANGDDQA